MSKGNSTHPSPVASCFQKAIADKLSTIALSKFALCTLLVVLLANDSLLAAKQKPTKTKDESTTSAEQKAAEPAKPVAQPDIAQSALSILRATQQFPADYIPCVFEQKDLLGLRLMPVSPTLTSADSENLKQSLLSEAAFQTSISALTPEKKRLFFAQIVNGSFEGLTPSQAVAAVLKILGDVNAQSNTEVTRVKALSEAAKRGDDLTDVVKAQLYGDVTYGSIGNFNEVLEQEIFKPMSARVHPDNASDQLKQDMARVALNKLAANASKARTVIQQKAEEQRISYEPGTTALTSALDALIRNASSATEEVTTPSHREDREAQQAIVETARQTIVSFQRPKDVGCAMSILSWNEVRHAFGSLIAREYIAVQIVVRNLNDKEDYALHDAELSVDSDIQGGLGRFYSGRDKVIVRGLALAQQNTNKRNLLVHSAEAIGTLMSAVIPIASGTFADAAGVYNGGFLPGLRSTWPDLSVTQLNLLNDVGFSSSTNYKTVVPKSGSVMFVIFVPSKQYENGWWTQPCAEGIALPDKSSETSASYGTTTAKQQARLGIDLKLARDLCLDYWREQQPKPSPDESKGAESSQQSLPTSNAENTSSEKESKRTVPKVTVKPVHYKDWSPDALAIFRELAFAVVAGTHIQEESQKQPVLAQMKCPVDDAGKLQISAEATATAVSCDLTGQNLDKVSLLRLRNLDDQTDLQTAEGTVSISGDPTKGRVAFTVATLGNLEKPNYKAYLVTAAAVEITSEQVVHLDLTPVVQKVLEDNWDLTSDQKQFTLAGFHLNRIKEIQLFEEPGQAPSLSKSPDRATATQLSFTVKASDGDLKKKSQQEKGVVLTVAFVSVDPRSKAVTTSVKITLKSQKTPAAQSSGAQVSQPVNESHNGQPTPQKAKPAKKKESSSQNRDH